MAPVFKVAHECAPPAVTDVALVPSGSETRTGLGESVVEPSPSSPSAFEPQHMASPVSKVAHECVAPAVIDVALALPDRETGTGVGEVVVEPSPS